MFTFRPVPERLHAERPGPPRQHHADAVPPLELALAVRMPLGDEVGADRRAVAQNVGADRLLLDLPVL